LDPLFAYLMIAAGQYENQQLADWYNVGPDDRDCLTTGALAALFTAAWGEGLTWQSRAEQGPHEAGLLLLDCTKLKRTFGWRPTWDIQAAVEKTVLWTKAYRDGADMAAFTDKQIGEFLADRYAYAKH
jgi:CDP-glucose 4,6-dehydratase